MIQTDTIPQKVLLTSDQQLNIGTGAAEFTGTVKPMQRDSSAGTTGLDPGIDSGILSTGQSLHEVPSTGHSVHGGQDVMKAGMSGKLR